MADFNLNDLLEAAKDAGYETKQLPAGRYTDAEVTNVNLGKTQAGGVRIGVRFKIHGGPENGNGVWDNINVPNPKTAKDPEKASKAAAIFLRRCAALGVELSNDLDSSFKAIVGRHYDIEVEYTTSGQWTNTNIKVKGQAASAVPAAPAVVQPALDLDDDDDLEDRPV